jgi:hypothetical protein
MRIWTPQSLYEAAPWVLGGAGVALAVGMMVWSLAAGLWTVWRSLLCVGGGGLAVLGGITLQFRREYRARSKWRRETRR